MGAQVQMVLDMKLVENNKFEEVKKSMLAPQVVFLDSKKRRSWRWFYTGD
jgi:hypothetical protein